MGICIGAKLSAADLGEKVFPSGLEEIGFSKLTLTDAGTSSRLRHVDDVAVLHWNGVTYSLPFGAENLASPMLVQQQTFSIGPNILCPQFHPEAVTDQHFENWRLWQAAELAASSTAIPAPPC